MEDRNKKIYRYGAISMKRYLKIYWLFMKYSIAEMLAFRMSFMQAVSSHLLWAFFTFLSMFLLTAKTKNVVGWSREELFLLTAVFNIMTGIFRAFITRNMDRFGKIIHYGDLDSFLLKPIDTQFWMSLRYFNLGAFVRVPVAIGVTAYILHLLHQTVIFGDILFFSFILLCGLIGLYSIWFLTMTILIWFSNLTNLEEFLNSLNGITRYPKEIFENVSLFFLLVFLPITLVVSVPTKILLHEQTYLEMSLVIFFAIILFIASRYFWKYGLRFYSSASG